MTHYFLIAQDGPDYEICDAYMERQTNGLKKTDFIRGTRFHKGEVQEPVLVKLDHTENVMSEFFSSPLILREDIVEDIKKFGVDNLDFYEVNLVDESSGKIWTDYKICNVVGLIDVFDMNKSELHPDSPPEVAYLFNEIVIDAEKAKGHHIFRPYGRMSQILVSEELKDCLESKGKYPHMEFVHPSEFA